jgi:hypothetical protein
MQQFKSCKLCWYYKKQMLITNKCWQLSVKISQEKTPHQHEHRSVYKNRHRQQTLTRQGHIHRHGQDDWLFYTKLRAIKL